MSTVQCVIRVTASQRNPGVYKPKQRDAGYNNMLRLCRKAIKDQQSNKAVREGVKNKAQYVLGTSD